MDTVSLAFGIFVGVVVCVLVKLIGDCVKIDRDMRRDLRREEMRRMVAEEVEAYAKEHANA